MIPKKIHYVWVGKNPLTKLAEKCIESWEKFCPDFEIIRWDESNFDINSNRFCKEAYENKKWAFVSDYIRFKVLYEEGGIYMDTDVEVKKPLDEYLKHPSFSGFECSNYIPTGIIGAEKGNKWAKMVLDHYKYLPFVKIDGSFENMPNVLLISDLTKQNYSINFDDSFQDLGDVVFYPHKIFCPEFYSDGKYLATKDTVTVHHFASSWVPKKFVFKKKLKISLCKVLIFFIGRKNFEKLKKMKQKKSQRKNKDCQQEMYTLLKKEKQKKAKK